MEGNGIMLTELLLMVVGVVRELSPVAQTLEM